MDTVRRNVDPFPVSMEGHLGLTCCVTRLCSGHAPPMCLREDSQSPPAGIPPNPLVYHLSCLFNDLSKESGISMYIPAAVFAWTY